MRVKHWERLLDDYVNSAPQFQWGRHDCALWCADWVLQITGRDFASEWRGLYSDEAGLQSLMHDRGYQCASEIADAAFNRVGVNFAQRGDVVLHPQGALGICNGIYGHFLTEKGVTKYPTCRCGAAWKVN